MPNPRRGKVLPTELVELVVTKMTSTVGSCQANPTVASFITCVYDSFWWVGMVEDINPEQGDMEVTFLHPHGPRKSFTWPTAADRCYVPLQNILCSILAPTISTDNGHSYEISDTDYQKTISAFEKFHYD